MNPESSGEPYDLLHENKSNSKHKISYNFHLTGSAIQQIDEAERESGIHYEFPE